MKINSQADKVHKNKQFTIIELLVIITIIGILATLILPSLGSARQRAHRSVCKNAQKQLGLALQLYTLDQEILPTSEWYEAPYYGWLTALGPDLGEPDANPLIISKKVRCPIAYRLTGKDNRRGTGMGYSANLGVDQNKAVDPYDNDAPKSLNSFTHPALTILLGDNANDTPDGTSYLIGPAENTGSRHRQGVNLLWADFHVSRMTTSSLQSSPEFYKIVKD